MAVFIRISAARVNKQVVYFGDTTGYNSTKLRLGDKGFTINCEHIQCLDYRKVSPSDYRLYIRFGGAGADTIEASYTSLAALEEDYRRITGIALLDADTQGG